MSVAAQKRYPLPFRITSIAKKRFTVASDQNIEHPTEVLKEGHFSRV